MSYPFVLLVCKNHPKSVTIDRKKKHTNKEEKNLNIELTKEQYTKLLDILYAGIIMINGHRDSQDYLEGYEELLQHIYSFAKEYDLDNLINYNKEHKQYFVTKELESSTGKLIDQYDEETFLHTLSLKLAQRDTADEIEGQHHVDKDSVLQRIIERQARYKEELKENGLKHFHFNKRATAKENIFLEGSQEEELEGSVLQLHIRLKDVEPTIWRRVLVREDISFYTFNEILHKVMGWSGFQQYEFEIQGQRISEETEADLWDSNTEIISAKEKRLKDFALQSNDLFVYTYDFGDNWVHEILVERVYDIEDESRQYPVCIDGERKGPMENIGGPWGYMELLHIVDNPQDPQYEEIMEWLGEEFHPEDLDLEKINQQLQDLK